MGELVWTPRCGMTQEAVRHSHTMYSMMQSVTNHSPRDQDPQLYWTPEW